MFGHSSMRRVSYLCLLASLMVVRGSAQSSNDNFLAFVKNVQEQIEVSSERTCSIPNDEDLRTWTKALYLFRMHNLDSCKSVLSHENYTIVQIADHKTGHVYDVFKESAPAKKSWGTFVYNRQHSKRLFIHVTHPADDGYVAQIGAELFQKTGAEWLYIAGTSRNDKVNRVQLDAARLRETLLQRWHEVFTDLTHITLSIHGFDKKYYDNPVSETDIVISNGKTSDDQWGISQISLSYRDSLRTNGFSCAVAMYDSGYSSLGWGVSPQGMFSNDSVGFGHWMNIELSKEVRSNSAEYAKFIALTDRALEVAGKKVSQQVNRAFGLVSPRSLKIDSRHGLLFPPSSGESYRIVSFNSGNLSDTLNIRVGGWLQFPGASMARIDTSSDGLMRQLRRSGGNGVRSALASIVEQEPAEASAYFDANKKSHSDSAQVDGSDASTADPLQVHRIPLRRRVIAGSESEYASAITPYRWEGALSDDFSPARAFLQFADDRSSQDESGDLPNFLIPIINRSLGRYGNNVVEIRMTQLLARRIAKLVAEHNESARDVQLAAEVSDKGDYFLRIFPSAAPK
ncbi:MAG TPA: hypothetical protein VL633_09225 [Bacteroidota bacterium]|nr:hypothetical protein [Bacteroidota bacterium]